MSDGVPYLRTRANHPCERGETSRPSVLGPPTTPSNHRPRMGDPHGAPGDDVKPPQGD